MPNPEFDLLNLMELADRLADIRTTRTHEGYGTDNAVIRAGLERRIMERVAGGATNDASKVVVDHPVVVSVQDRTLESETAEVRPGGIFVPGKADFKDGAACNVEITTESNFKQRAKGVIRAVPSDETGIFVAFENLDDSAMRRATRLVLELLRNPAN